MTWSNHPGRYRGLPRGVAHAIRVRDSYTCQMCGRHGDEVDHKINVRAGGTDAPENLQTLCSRCHVAKTSAESARGRSVKRSRLKLPTDRHPGLR